jgi:hypothetical protein
MLEERAPASLVLLCPLANAENLSIAALVHADRNQQVFQKRADVPAGTSREEVIT